MKLTDTHIAKLAWKPQAYLLPDSRGLQLAVSPRGRKTWQLRSTIAGKRAVLTVGYWPEMTTRSARQRAQVFRKSIAAGEDPRKTLARPTASVAVRVFAKRWLAEVVEKRRKDPAPVRRVVERDLLPLLGGLTVQKVTAADLRSIVYRRRDDGRPASALNIRDTMHRLFSYARNCGLIQHNPADEVDRRYIGRLKSRTRVLTAVELKSFFQGLKSLRLGWRSSVALELLLLTLARKSELLEARWKDVDLAAGTWEVPAEHSKTGVPHVVYLSTRAVRLFEMLWPLDAERPFSPGPHSGTRRLDPNEFVLQSQWSRTQPMAANLLNKALLRVKWGIPHFTVHDLRRTASTHLNEKGYQPDVIEKALNHSVRGGVRGVYNRAQYSAERRKMLQEWADWLEGLKDGDR